MLFLRGIIGQQTERIRVYSFMCSLQNRFDVGKLSVFGTTHQARRHQWTVGQLSSAHQSVQHLPVTHLPLLRTFTTVLHGNCASTVHLNLYPLYPLFTVVRFRRRKMIGRKSDDPEAAPLEDEAEDTDEEIDDDTDVSSLAFQEDALLTSNYRDMTTHVKSARLDALVSAGLGLPRNKVEELFLASQLRLNGQRLIKKSQQMDEGDYVDYVFTNEDGAEKLKRVRVLKIEDTGVGGAKQKIYLRVWRSPQDP